MAFLPQPARIGILLALLLLGTAGIPRAQTASAREYQLKAVFIFNFAQFVEWPDSLSGPDTPLVIGILGEDPFGPYLEEAVRGEKIHGHPIRVERFQRADEIRNCRIVFISGLGARTLGPTLDSLKSRHVLTVGESEDFSRHGGMIRFATEQSKIRLKINLRVVQDANLVVSSKLLRIADIIAPEKG